MKEGQGNPTPVASGRKSVAPMGRTADHMGNTVAVPTNVGLKGINAGKPGVTAAPTVLPIVAGGIGADHPIVVALAVLVAQAVAAVRIGRGGVAEAPRLVVAMFGRRRSHS